MKILVYFYLKTKKKIQIKGEFSLIILNKFKLINIILYYMIVIHYSTFIILNKK